MNSAVPSWVVVDPATVALHEIAEPARLRTLIRTMRTRRVQDAPVLLTDEPHGLLVLDGVHRTNAMISLGIPRMLAVVLPRDQIGEPGGWTHRLDLPGEIEEVRRRLAAAPGIALSQDLAATDLVVAQVLTERETLSVQATRPGRAGMADAYHALARTYATLPYRRVKSPDAPAPGEMQVRWVAPPLSEVENLVTAYGALPAGITRFDLPAALLRGTTFAGQSSSGVDFARLDAAVDPDQARRLVAEVRGQTSSG